MNKPDLKKEFRDVWNEFNQLIIKFTPNFIYAIYQNKPLFWLLVIFAITLEIVIGFWVYGNWIAPQSEITK
ncbi:MAG: hypothetical protein RBR45_06925 [Pseudomonas sp.]|nr:hypothetical protein [Pseudomonas sp.]